MRTTLKLSEIIDGWIADTDILPATKADYRRKVNLWLMCKKRTSLPCGSA